MGADDNKVCEQIHLTPGVTEPIKINIRGKNTKKCFIRFTLTDGYGRPVPDEPFLVHVAGHEKVLEGRTAAADKTKTEDGTIIDAGEARVKVPEPLGYLVTFPGREVCGKQVVLMKQGTKWTTIHEQHLSSLDRYELQLPGLLLAHRWLEYHADLKQDPKSPDGFDGKRDDFKAVAGVEKKKLHLCFLEKACSTVEAIPDPSLWLSWTIRDANDKVLKTHPDFEDKDKSSVPKRGRLSWMWDGRLAPGKFVPAGKYVSVAQLRDRKDGDKVVQELRAELELEGHPLRVFVRGVPKTDAEMKEQHAALGSWVNDDGRVFTRDAWIEVYRGEVSPGHLVFLAHGAIEASEWDSKMKGAIGTPQETDFKAYLHNRKYPKDTGTPISALEYISLKHPQLGETGGTIRLENKDVFNPYYPSKNGMKAGVQAHPNSNDFTINDTSAGCTTVTNAKTTAHRKSDGVLNPDARFAYKQIGLSEDGKEVVDDGPELRNKQTEEPAGVGRADDHASPILVRDQLSPHMQPTMEQALYGGFKSRELAHLLYKIADECDAEPLESREPQRVRFRMRLLAPPRDSIYYVHHGAVVFGHRRADDTTLEANVPHLVIRRWSGLRRNLLVRNGRCEVRWWIEDRSGNSKKVVAHVVPPYQPPKAKKNQEQRDPGPVGEPAWTKLPDGGHLSRTIPAGLTGVVAVFEYRVKLDPADGTWEADDGIKDLMAGGQPISERVEGNLLVGRNELPL